jgi:coatomer subunit beta'
MPLRLDVVKKFSTRCDRVKAVDIHPDEPWVLAALYSGQVVIWDHETAAQVKSFQLTELPVRCAKFVVRQQWFVASSDDMVVRCFNYNTMEKVAEFEAHADYIRYLEVHPTLPYLLSASDDMQIRLWNWERRWQCEQTFEGHAHYVMMARFNPKDPNVFASASLDRSIKVWGIGASAPHMSLEGHERGVNCIDFYAGGDKPYLVSGADDHKVKIWDYQTKTCVQTLDGHEGNVAACVFHPKLPIILTGAEDGVVRIWHNSTYRAETTLNYGMERCWALACQQGTNVCALGFDEGVIAVALGEEQPVCSMDPTGKLIFARNTEVKAASLRGLAAELEDGERLAPAAKDLGSVEIYPQSARHNCNGRFVVVCGDGEYVIYTAQALRNKAFGAALDFVWSSVGTGDYCVRESPSELKIFKNFKEHAELRPRLCTAEGVFGGALVAVKGPDCVVFYDWETAQPVRKIDVEATAVHWSDSGELCAIVCADSFYVLQFNRDAVAEALAGGRVTDEGVDGAFELLHDVPEAVKTGQWVGDCFLFTSKQSHRLSYCVGGEVLHVAHLGTTMYLLGFLPKEDRVFLMDKAMNVVSYRLLMPMLEYQTAVVRRDFDAANKILPSVPRAEFDAVARFLESQGFPEEALAVSSDPDHRFDLAVKLSKLDVATEILTALGAQAAAEEGDAAAAAAADGGGGGGGGELQHRWKQIGDLALAAGQYDLAEKAAAQAGDIAGLLLMHSSAGNAAGMAAVAAQAQARGLHNIAFLALLLLGRANECIELLIGAGRLPEAAFFARTYLPSQMSRVVRLWRADLAAVSTRAADSLADPADYANLFPDLQWALKAEEARSSLAAQGGGGGGGAAPTFAPAADFAAHKGGLSVDLIALLKEAGAGEDEAGAGQDEAGAGQDEAAAEEAAEETAAAAAAAAAEAAAEEAAAEEAAEAAATAEEEAAEAAAAAEKAAAAERAAEAAVEEAATEAAAEEAAAAAAKAAAGEAAAAAAEAEAEAAAKAAAEEAAKKTPDDSLDLGDDLDLDDDDWDDEQ